jgi:hypothetical protein
VAEIEEEIVNLLSSDAPLITLLTGGIHGFEDMGKPGLTHKNVPSAFTLINEMYQIKPSLVVRVADDVETYARHDSDTQETSADTIVRLWYYQYSDYDTIHAAAKECRRLLHSRVNANIGYTRRLNVERGLVAPEFDNVSLRIDEYLVKRVIRD